MAYRDDNGGGDDVVGVRDHLYQWIYALVYLVAFVVWVVHLDSHLSSFTMSRIKQLLEKLEVANEPGLSNAQLMLTNNDLRPGEVFE